MSAAPNAAPAPSPAPEAPAPVDETERKRRQRSRSIVLALVLGGLVVTFYAITLVQLGHQSDAVEAARESAGGEESQ